MERIINGGVVTAVVALPNTEDVVVLLDPERRPDGVLRWHQFHNVLRITSSDAVCWRAELVPEETTVKCWYGIRFDDALRAWTWSWDCELDPDTGRIVHSTFTK